MASAGFSYLRNIHVIFINLECYKGFFNIFIFQDAILIF